MVQLETQGQDAPDTSHQAWQVGSLFSNLFSELHLELNEPPSSGGSSQHCV